MSRIVWLASYPKSGNTWLRAFLHNLREDGEQPIDINSMAAGVTANNREHFDDVLGVESSDLLPAEIDGYRPLVYRQMAAESDETLFFKVHDAYAHAQSGEPIFPADASLGAIYVVRNPLDVAISLAHHWDATFDDVIATLAKEDALICSKPRKLHIQLGQRLLTWSEHVCSWLDQREIPVDLMRYEDMHRAPEETFGAAARFAGLPSDVKRVARAVAHSRFDVLKAQEEAHGFKERRGKTEAFFRKGRVGDGYEALTGEQIARLVRDHGAAMRRLAYLPAQHDATGRKVRQEIGT